LSGSDANAASQPFAAFASQLPKPALHATPHAPAAQVAVPLAGTGQTVQAAPHASGSLSVAPGVTHFAPQRWLGAAHVIPQVSATHVAVPPAGAGHAVHAGPHAVGSVVGLHAPAHAWNCGLHVNEQTDAVHALVALATTGHFTPHAPQLSTLVVGFTHCAPQLSGAAAVQPSVHANVCPEGAQSGVGAGQTALHAPQLAGFARSTSQPSAPFLLQSAYPLSHAATTHVRAWQAIVPCVDGHAVQLGLPQP
jgi:hypothetical protein